MLFVRPGELRQAEWTQIDLDKGEWRYRVTKTNTDHLVPLATQAVVILRELKVLTGNGRYVFPGARDVTAKRCTSGLITSTGSRLGPKLFRSRLDGSQRHAAGRSV